MFKKLLPVFLLLFVVACSNMQPQCNINNTKCKCEKCECYKSGGCKCLKDSKCSCAKQDCKCQNCKNGNCDSCKQGACKCGEAKSEAYANKEGKRCSICEKCSKSNK